MIKWLICLLWGKSCVWQTVHSERYSRGAYGIFINVRQPVVMCEHHIQRCQTCGKMRTREVVITPS
jgi:hypothetical protein